MTDPSEKPTPEFETEACRSCCASVIWCETDRGKSMPVDAEPSKGANLAVEHRDAPRRPLARVVKPELAYGRPDLRTSHFVTCPHAKSWRRKGVTS